MIVCFVLLLSLINPAFCQYALTYPEVGYDRVSGTGRDSRANFGEIETRVLPYRMLSGSEEGYVHAFEVNTQVSGQPFRLYIWRRRQGSWTSSGEWRNEYVTQSADQLNGDYTAVYRSEEMYSTNHSTVYLQAPVRVQQNDFVGFSYRTESPFLYDIDTECTNQYTRVALTSSDYPQPMGWYTFDDNEARTTNSCRIYPIRMRIEVTDIDEDRCERLNVLDLSSTYTLTSHAGYPTAPYTDNLEKCWVVHSYDDNYYVTFTLDSAVMFDLEYYSPCRYDAVIFQRKNGQSLDEIGKYCDASEFPYFNEVFVDSSIVRLNFTTDYSRVRDGFQFNFRAVETDYDPSPSSSSSGSNPSAGASTNDIDCSKSKHEWKWECLTKTEKALLVCVITLLFIVLLIVILCVIWLCCFRPREKVDPERDSLADEYITPINAKYSAKAIPYEEEPVYSSQYEEAYPVYESLPLSTSSSKQPEVRTERTYGQPKGLRPLSDPLGRSHDQGQRY